MPTARFTATVLDASGRPVTDARFAWAFGHLGAQGTGNPVTYAYPDLTAATDYHVSLTVTARSSWAG